MVQHLVMELNIYLFFPPPDKKRLWYRDEHKEHKLWFEVDTEVISLKAFSKSSQTGEKEARAHTSILMAIGVLNVRLLRSSYVFFPGSNHCSENNGNCHDLCLATPAGRTCRCAHDQILLNATHCGPARHCSDGSRQCLDRLSCQAIEKFCNGLVDCHDHSDENCESVLDQ